MGINGLWKLLEPAIDSNRSMTRLAVEDGFWKNPQYGAYRLGIDASIWIAQIERGCHGPHRGTGPYPEGRALFSKFAKLLATCVQPIFVFDGPHRPVMKRDKNVITRNHWMNEDVQSLAQAFGFECHQAPGEAEAELAMMNQLGIIDGVLTDDGDVFIFGAQRVIRNVSYQDNEHDVDVYRADTIARHESIALTRDDLILIAILAGGDYHKGLPGCGITVARSVARYNLGSTLCNAVSSMPDSSLKSFMDEWRDSLRNVLRLDLEGHIGRRFCALADRVPDDFPNILVVRNYLQPVTTNWLPIYQPPLPQPPDIRKIARWLELENIFPPGLREIRYQFQEQLWPGLVLREYMKCAFNNMNFIEPLPASNLFTITIMRKGQGFQPSKLKVEHKEIDNVLR